MVKVIVKIMFIVKNIIYVYSSRQAEDFVFCRYFSEFCFPVDK